MKTIITILSLSVLLLSGCESQEQKAMNRRVHLASLTCESSKSGRDKDELQAISDACFKKGSFHKSNGQKW